MIILGDAHHATSLLGQASERALPFAAALFILILVVVVVVSLQFDHRRFPEMRSRMGNQPTPAGQSE